MILIDRSLGKLLLLIEKIDITVEKNERLLKKATLKIKHESLVKLSDTLQKDLEQQLSQCSKVEVRVVQHYDTIKRKIESLQSTRDKGNRNIQEEQQEAQIAMHMACI